jgi:TRAP-type C4-dicarboxylate transport system permease small subunit
MLKRIRDYSVRIVEVIAIVGILLILTFTAYEVSAREIFGLPTIWTNEITSYLLVWFGMMSIIYAYDKKAHVSVDLIYRKFSPRVKIGVDLFNHILTFVFALFILVYGYKYWWLAYSNDWRHFGMLDVPMAYTRMAIPVVGLFLAFQILFSISDSFSSFFGKNPAALGKDGRNE